MAIQGRLRSLVRDLFRFGRTVALTVLVVVGGTLALHQANDDWNVTALGFTDAEMEVIESAVGRFRDAGLTLPPVHIQYWEPEVCDTAGTARETWPIKLVRVCNVTERVVVHELAHVWTYRHLDSQARQEWTDLRETSTWAGREVPWAERSGEHAADILTWWLYWGEQGHTIRRISGETTYQRYMDDVTWLLAESSDQDAQRQIAERQQNIVAAYEENAKNRIVSRVVRGAKQIPIRIPAGPGDGRRYADPDWNLTFTDQVEEAAKTVADARVWEWGDSWVQRGPYALR